MIKIQLRCTEDNTVVNWTISEILEEINRDRSETWSNYNKDDWEEGLSEWTEYEIV